MTVTSRSTELRDNGGAARRKKLAEVVASQIERDIIDRGWPTGEVLGSEAELLDRYEVSRGVFREAVRLVEHKQIGHMRRGPGGGLVVTAPAAAPVLDAVAVYARYADITLAELFEARKVLEAAATELAVAALAEPDLAELREMVKAEARGELSPRHDRHELHRRIGQLTGNPAVELFSDVSTRLTALYVGSLKVSASSQKQWGGESARAHTAIVEALVRGNSGLASHRMRRHLDALEDLLRKRRASQTIQSELLGRQAGGAQSKLAEELARSIFRGVAEQGWRVGEVIGSEAALIERHEVSRAVLREAVRLLEYHQIARMRRGPGGGLVVTRPGVEAITEAMTLYLEHRGIRPAHLYEMRSALELAAVDLATQRLDADGVTALRDALDAEQRDPRANLNEVGHVLHLAIADLSGNRLIALFLRILISLSARHTPSPRAPAGRGRARIGAEVHRTHSAIVDAITSGNAELARHRMQKHLAALVPWYS